MVFRIHFILCCGVIQVFRPGACAEYYYQRNIFSYRAHQQLPSDYCLPVMITAETWFNGSRYILVSGLVLHEMTLQDGRPSPSLSGKPGQPNDTSQHQPAGPWTCLCGDGEDGGAGAAQTFSWPSTGLPEPWEQRGRCHFICLFNACEL